MFAAALPSRAPSAPACETPQRVGVRGDLAAVRCDAGAVSLDGAARLLFGLALDLNRADAAALESLPGVGAGRARAIVAARAAQPFCSTADLERVPGFGPVTAARVAPFVAVAAAPGCAGS